MTTATTFALAYLLGVAAGAIGGHVLPWWISGIVAWAFLIGRAAWWIWSTRDDVVLIEHGASRERIVSLLIDAIKTQLRKINNRRAIDAGGFWGALAGAFAVDAAEVLDALVWPGHEIDGVLFAVLVALAWLVGVVASDEDVNPWRAGLGLYLVTVALVVFPALWEVL